MIWIQFLFLFPGLGPETSCLAWRSCWDNEKCQKCGAMIRSLDCKKILEMYSMNCAEILWLWRLTRYLGDAKEIKVNVGNR